jgi:hypothetical protein
VGSRRHDALSAGSIVAPGPAIALLRAAGLGAHAGGDFAVTLLAAEVVDDFVRLTGVVRVRHPDARVATIPPLEAVLPDGVRLAMVDARVQPQGKIAWVAWTNERPQVMPGLLEARISHLVLEYRAGYRRRPRRPSSRHLHPSLVLEPGPALTEARGRVLRSRSMRGPVRDPAASPSRRRTVPRRSEGLPP